MLLQADSPSVGILYPQQFLATQKDLGVFASCSLKIKTP